MIHNDKLIAFFCMEYALDEDPTTYAGGLGILAGDYLLEAADQNISLIALGLHYGVNTPKNFSILPDAEGGMLLIDVPIGNEIVKAKVWHRQIKNSVRVMLFDTDVPENSAENRSIAKNLYDADLQIRIKQQLVIGIGGVRLLKKLNMEPAVYHLNEGHTAFAALALQLEGGGEIKKIVATKHTIFAAAGIFIPKADFDNYISPYCKSFGADIDAIFEKGRYELYPDQFSTTKFLINSSSICNGVSVLHTVYEKRVHQDSTLIPITNGVYKKRWQSLEWEDDIQKLEAQDVWKIKKALRNKLLELVKEKTGEVLNQDACTVVWARRFAAYKRPFLLFSDLERLKKIVSDEKRPIQFIISGKAHPADALGQEVVAKIIALSQTPEFKGKIVYVPDYSILISRYLVQGADIWLNTPELGKEACGTSGIKASLNGALQCSVSDGWVDEVDWRGIGWILSEEKTIEDLYGFLEKEIPDHFYDRDEKNVPTGWIEDMKSTMEIADKGYTTERMIKDYGEKVYSL